MEYIGEISNLGCGMSVGRDSIKEEGSNAWTHGASIKTSHFRVVRREKGTVIAVETEIGDSSAYIFELRVDDELEGWNYSE